VKALAQALCAIALLIFTTGAAAVRDDAYLAGYATAVIERDLGLKLVSLVVQDGNVLAVVEDLGNQPAERIEAALMKIEGIHRAEVKEADSEEASATPTEADPAPEPAIEPDAFELLPRFELFNPLIADPRQPHFSASYVWYLDDPEFTHVGSANFGETFALAGGGVLGGRWELGFFGGVFSIFDLDAPSADLVNTDFRAGPTLSARRGRVSAQMRLYHQSSHLGDECLLRHQSVHRVNLSYEGVELLFSGEPWPWLRLYGGGGRLLHTEPHLLPLSAQAGFELQSPWAFLGSALRPLAALDFETREENDWHEEISFSAGVQFENPKLSKLHVQLLGNFFKGNSPNGQFLGRRIETVGIGLHFYY
jgi:hypothetical protein